ncbi:MAG TPA: cobyric acid synthase, partial [Acidimicrobiales bacterium]|nr:cobyric acid synthase [Acidimicrobiales bacterium]
MTTAGSLLVLGTSSGAGKTTLVTGLCRWLARQGVAVAPFKAQNMSLNSYVTADGGEIGRAQAVQAWAAGVEPEVAMNPVLLKPGTGGTSQLVVLGHPAGELGGRRGWEEKAALLDLVVEAYRSLRARHDVVVCEGAGSPAEINLRAGDIVNLGFARAAGVPAVVVGDIDRGGVFAAFAGTLALLDGPDQDLVHGFVVNRFRGDPGILSPGLAMLGAATGRPTYGVLPLVEGVAVDAEDSLDVAPEAGPGPPRGDEVLRVAVVHLPRASNLTDLDPLRAEPGVVVRLVRRPEELGDADLVLLPGTRATVADLAWVRERGFDRALAARAARGLCVLGVCGGFQMLGTTIEDTVESGAGEVPGLGLLPLRTVFGPDKVLARPRRRLPDGAEVGGYEIRHGRVEVVGGEPLLPGEGCRVGSVAGTSWHGLFENDGWRRGYLAEVAAASGRAFVAAPGTDFAAWRRARIDRLADLVADHLDTGALLEVLEGRSGPVPRV